MDSYSEYLERELELREQELDIYKSFIENELKCRIREEVVSEKRFDAKGVRTVRFKVITIPQSQYIVKLSEGNVL